MDFTLTFVLVCALIGLSKGGLIGPIGGSLALPLLVQSSFNGEPITVIAAAGVVLVLLMLGDLFAVPMFWKWWDWKYIKLMLPASILGVIMGTALLVWLEPGLLKKILGVITLIAVVYKLLSERLKALEYQPRDWHGYLAGWGSGFTSALANTGGPPVTAYLLLQKIGPRRFVGTQALFFMFINWAKVPGYAAAGAFNIELVSVAWPALALIPLMIWVSKRVIHRVNARAFDIVLTGLLFYAGISLLLS